MAFHCSTYYLPINTDSPNPLWYINLLKIVQEDLDIELQSERRATPTLALKAVMAYYNKGLSCCDKLSYNKQNVSKDTQSIGKIVATTEDPIA